MTSWGLLGLTFSAGRRYFRGCSNTQWFFTKPFLPAFFARSARWQASPFSSLLAELSVIFTDWLATRNFTKMSVRGLYNVKREVLNEIRGRRIWRPPRSVTARARRKTTPIGSFFGPMGFPLAKIVYLTTALITFTTWSIFCVKDNVLLKTKLTSKGLNIYYFLYKNKLCFLKYLYCNIWLTNIAFYFTQSGTSLDPSDHECDL